MRLALVAVFAGACAKLANIPSYGIDDGGGTAPDVVSPTADAMPRSTCWGLPGCITAIAAGYNRTCAIAGGDLYCWGNVSGNSDDVVTVPAMLATDVTGVSLSADVRTAGTFGVGCFTSSAGLSCWGDASFAQLQQHGQAAVPLVIDPTGYNLAAVGADHVCVTTMDGSVSCWGADDDLQLGSGSAGSICGFAACSNMPRQVLGAAMTLTTGLSHSCARASDAVFCWGLDDRGQLGNGSEGSGSASGVVMTLSSSGIQQIAAGSRHTCMVDNASAWSCWGDGANGALGTGKLTDVVTAAALVTSPPLRAIAAGAKNTCGITDAEAVECWGDNTTGIVGTGLGVTAASPVMIGTPDQVELVAVGFDHACALMARGDVYCWGGNAHGQLGDGSLSHQTCNTTAADCSPTPVEVSAPP